MGILPNAQPNILWCLCCAQLRFEPAMVTRAGETCGVRQKPETSAPSSPCIQAGRISRFRGKNRRSCSTELLRQSINLGDTHLKEPLLALVISCSYPFAVSAADSMEVKLIYILLFVQEWSTRSGKCATSFVANWLRIGLEANLESMSIL